MKQFYLLAFFLSISFLLQGQEHIPIHIDSLIHASKKHQIIKWDDEDVIKMDSMYRPQYYEGGALVMPLEKYTALDTVDVADISGIDPKKVKFTPIISKHSFSDTKFTLAGSIEEVSFRNHSVFKEKAEVFVFYKYEASFRPGFISPQRDYVLLPEFKSEFPDGLPKKQVVIYREYYDLPYVISWTKWEEVDKEKLEKNLRPNPYFIYHRDKNFFYYIFKPGYYSEWNKVEEGRRFVTKIQIALKERSYNVAVTGNWNRRTHIALIKFQKDFFLYENTYEELLKELDIEQ